MDLSNYKLKKNGPKSKRADSIQQLADLIGVDFKIIMRKTFKMTQPEILEIYLKARAWPTNAPALANKLIKEKRLEIKKQLSTTCQGSQS